jgi:hypothetical protein
VRPGFQNSASRKLGPNFWALLRDRISRSLVTCSAPTTTGKRFAVRKRTGGCNCGQLSFEVSGQPVRVGLGHCQVCRKETGSIGNFFAGWQADRVLITGETPSWRLSTDNGHFCPACG